MHIHILGICGTFMAGIASLAKSSGHKVTGCDKNVYPPMSTQLKNQDIAIIEGFDKDQVSLNPCLLYTSPSPRDVEESRMPSSA